MISLDVLFCHVDDFCQAFEAQWHKQQLKHGGIKRIRATRLCLSEIITIVIAFHQLIPARKPRRPLIYQNHSRNFKHF